MLFSTTYVFVCMYPDALYNIMYERGPVLEPFIIGSWVNCVDDGVCEAVGDAPQRECQQTTLCG